MELTSVNCVIRTIIMNAPVWCRTLAISVIGNKNYGNNCIIIIYYNYNKYILLYISIMYDCYNIEHSLTPMLLNILVKYLVSCLHYCESSLHYHSGMQAQPLLQKMISLSSCDCRTSRDFCPRNTSNGRR